MSSGTFVRQTTFTLITGVLAFLVGIGTSVILARALGPEGKGLYALAMLLPTLILTLANMGVGQATVYFMARGKFRRQEILGSNVFLSLVIGFSGIILGLVIVLFLRHSVFPGVPLVYLLVALALIPFEILFLYTRYVLLGAQCIKKFNYPQIVYSVLFLIAITIALLGLKGGVIGAIISGLVVWLLVNIFVWHLLKGVSGGVEFKPNFSYIKKTLTYGLKIHFSHIIGILNYRVDIFFINGLLNPAAVGFYSVGVGLVEKLWMVSFAASIVLFPRVAGDANESKHREFTPLVARTVLWTTAIAAIILMFLSHEIVLLFYSETYLPAVSALQALLVGIVALSAGRVLRNYISGRGFPGLNIYVGLAAVVTNVVLNLLLIPNLGIVGAAWASTVSYNVSFLGALFFYCRLSGNSWSKVLLPQRRDWMLYWHAMASLGRWIRKRFKR